MPVNERIFNIRISHQKLNLIIVNCYALTEYADDEEKKKIVCITLETIFDALAKNCVRLIIGDLNAQIGMKPFFRSNDRK